jgi:hypothetical protein
VDTLFPCTVAYSILRQITIAGHAWRNLQTRLLTISCTSESINWVCSHSMTWCINFFKCSFNAYYVSKKETWHNLNASCWPYTDKKILLNLLLPFSSQPTILQGSYWLENKSSIKNNFYEDRIHCDVTTLLFS